MFHWSKLLTAPIHRLHIAEDVAVTTVDASLKPIPGWKLLNLCAV